MDAASSLYNAGARRYLFRVEGLKEFIVTRICPSLEAGDIAIEKIFGQASTRRYFRVRFSGPVAMSAESPLPRRLTRRPLSSLVIMSLPRGFTSPAEEITKIAPGAPPGLPFLNVQRNLEDLGVNVPAVFASDAGKGIVVLEDLGDRNLESVVSRADGGFFLCYYKKALDALVEFQTKTAAGPACDCIAAYRRFTPELMILEFEHFREYGIEDRLGVVLPETERQAFRESTAAIAERIALLPHGFTHRDFQSRNLMFKDYEFWLIDFQDALVGPTVYDLVALLRDSYVRFTPGETRTLLAYYLERLPAGHPYAGRGEDLERDFHLVTLQRKLKDAGRFQCIKTVKGNPDFLRHIPLSLEYVRDAFETLPDCAGLRDLIARHVPELR